MSPLNLKSWIAILLVGSTVWTSNAQTIEHVTFYRDVALVTWKAAGVQGELVVAQSRSAMDTDRVRVFPAKGNGKLGVSEGAQMGALSPEGEAQNKAWESQLEELTIELALRQAQLDLVEEDLEMLRANRTVGGTAESILVEDLEEVSDWMHASFRDALYRRVELRQEVAGMQANAEVIRAKQRELKSSRPHVLSAMWPEGESGEVWAEVAEIQGAQWAPKLQLQAVGNGLGVLQQRGRYRLDLPVPIAGNIEFVDENWPGFSGLSVGAEGSNAVEASYARRPSKNASAGTTPEAAVRAVGHRYVMQGNMSVGEWPRGEVVLNEVQVPLRRRFIGVPKRTNAVQMRVSVPKQGLSLLLGKDIRFLDEAGIPGVKPLRSTEDSLLIDAGPTLEWEVQRSKEEALCHRSPLGNRIQHRRAFLIEVTNRSSSPGELTLIEPLPNSRQLEIEVSPEELDGGRLDKAAESIVWSMNLKAGETRTVKFAYVVTHDKGVVFSEDD